MDAGRWLPLRILSRPGHGRRPWALWIVAWALTGAGLALFAATHSVPVGPRWGPRWTMAMGALMFSPMGAVVASRRPQNLIGWIYCCVGLLCGAQFLGQEYAVFAVLARPGSLPGGEWTAWLQNWFWIPAAALYLIYVPLLLPNGRLPSPRWRAVAWLAAGATGLLALATAVQPGRLSNFYPVVNPLGAGRSAALWVQVGNVDFYLLDLMIVAAAVSVVWRARRADALERQQLRWLRFAFAAGAVAVFLGTLVPALAAPLLLSAVLGMHAATGLAILRYRLYDLDVIINHTVVYGLLTAALAATYFGSVLVLQNLALALTGEQQSQLVTVLSTLAIASLFNPLRRRIQFIIDRRFFRRRYDAAQTLARFGRAVREDASGDLARLTDGLIRVVDETLQPRTISLWLRPPHKEDP